MKYNNLGGMIMNFNQHCVLCTDNETCDRSHVYVVQLDSEIANQKWFQEANPDYKTSHSCLYVGKTSHHPLCRLSMHENCLVGDWEGKQYECVCSRHNSGLSACELGNRSSTKAGKYMKGLLRHKIHKKWNPIPDQLADEAEKKLAESLRKKGYGVWTN